LGVVCRKREFWSEGEASMIARLGRRPFAWGWVLCAATALAADPAADELGRLTGDLDAANFAARERAVQGLVAAGGHAIEPLSHALRSGSAEASWRAAAALVQIAIDGDDDVFARATAALAASHSVSHSTSAKNLEELRAKQVQKRRAAAEASIRSLGGLFGLHVDEALALSLDSASPSDTTALTDGLDEALQKFAVLQPETPPAPELPPAPAPPPDLPGEGLTALAQAEPVSVEPPVGVLIADAYVSPELHDADVRAEVERALTLTDTWRGGDEGLADLRHLPDVVSVRLEQAQVSDAALTFISVLPRLRDMRVVRSPFTPAALGRFRQRHPNVTVFVTEQSASR
jgi:hypothetical protein